MPWISNSGLAATKAWIFCITSSLILAWLFKVLVISETPPTDPFVVVIAVLLYAVVDPLTPAPVHKKYLNIY